MLTCSIGPYLFDRALLDLEASINVMPMEIFDMMFVATLELTSIRLQLADSSLCYPEGIAKDIVGISYHQ